MNNLKKKRPVIGITSNYDTEKGGYFCISKYVSSIEKAGGLPVILPYVGQDELAQLLEQISGLVLTGGGDFTPGLFGTEPHPSLLRMIPERDNFEFPLAHLALEKNMPTLGICRGMQLLNVVKGGRIYPHTLDDLPQVNDHRDGTPLAQMVHSIDVDESSQLWKLCGEQSPSFNVNSMHHQAIKDVAPGFTISAWSDDGLIEAIEAADQRFAIGVQWHPEWMYDSEPACRNLFDNFVKVCSDALIT